MKTLVVMAVALVGCQSKDKESPSVETKVESATAEAALPEVTLSIPSFALQVDAPAGSTVTQKGDSNIIIVTKQFSLYVMEAPTETLHEAVTGFELTSEVLQSESDGDDYAIHAVYKASIGPNQHSAQVQRDIGDKTYRCGGTTEVQNDIDTMIRTCKSLRPSNAQ